MLWFIVAGLWIAGSILFLIMIIKKNPLDHLFEHCGSVIMIVLGVVFLLIVSIWAVADNSLPARLQADRENIKIRTAYLESIEKKLHPITQGQVIDTVNMEYFKTVSTQYVELSIMIERYNYNLSSYRWGNKNCFVTFCFTDPGDLETIKFNEVGK